MSQNNQENENKSKIICNNNENSSIFNNKTPNSEKFYDVLGKQYFKGNQSNKENIRKENKRSNFFSGKPHKIPFQRK